jgi:hypothetical protein
MNGKRWRFVSALGLLVAWSCTDDVAGNSVQTEDTVTARVIVVDSVLPYWERPLGGGATVAFLRMDSTNFDFHRDSTDGADLDVRTLGGRSVAFRKVYWDPAKRIGRLQVRLDSELLGHGARFVLRWKLPPVERQDSAAVWKGITDNQSLLLNSAPIDDFEHGALFNLLPLAQPWFTSHSDSATVSALSLDSARHGRAGTAIGVSYTTKASSEYAQIGTTFGNGFYNLRSMDSLVAWVRGSGYLSVSFDHNGTDVHLKAWAHVTLDTAWKRIRIRPRDFDPANGVGGNQGWDKVCTTVSHLGFLVSGNGQMWIDDVRIYGVNADDFR